MIIPNDNFYFITCYFCYLAECKTFFDAFVCPLLLFSLTSFPLDIEEAGGDPRTIDVLGKSEFDGVFISDVDRKSVFPL